MHTYNTADPMVVDGNGTITQPVFSGRNHTLKEISGSAQQPPGPDLAINASATLEHDNVYETPGSAAGTVLATDSGAVLLADPYLVAAGALAAGSSLGLLAESARLSPDNSLANLAFGIRQGSGMSKSSLTGTYWMVHLEFGMEASTAGETVSRSVGARTSTHTATFDGNGAFSIGVSEDVSGRLVKTGPTPDQPPEDTDVQLDILEEAGEAASGFTYTVAADGTVTVKEGNAVTAVGALSADGRILVLRVGEEGATYSGSGLILGLKRGSGMNNSSASGTYRSVEFGLEIEASIVPGQVDVSPISNLRAVGLNAGLGHLEMNGSGMVSVARSVQRDTHLRESSYVQQYSFAPDEVRDAEVQVSSHTDGQGDGTETHSYSVASNGKVTIDGSLAGYLSSDGKVFVLPIPESEPGYARTGLLIALKEP